MAFAEVLGKEKLNCDAFLIYSMCSFARGYILGVLCELIATPSAVEHSGDNA